MDTSLGRTPRVGYLNDVQLRPRFRKSLYLQISSLGRSWVILRCFDTVFRRSYRYFSIALKVILSSSDRYEISPVTDLRLPACRRLLFNKGNRRRLHAGKPQIEVCQNVALSYHYDNNKERKLKSIKAEFCAICIYSY